MNETPDNELRTETEIDALCDEFERMLQSGGEPRVESFVDRLNASDADRRRLARELILLDRDYRLALGDSPSEQDYVLQDAIQPAVAEAFEKTIAPSSSPRNEAEPAAAAPGDSTVAQAAIGDRISYFGDYELVDEIARGGMGVVYRAKQISLNRTVALKMILSGQLAGEDEVRRFQLEAEAAANLDHPGIVPIYDIGEHNGQHYFTMKLSEGQTLTALSPELRGDHQRIIELAAKIADAMHHAHQRGILHRDLKPGNVLVESDDQPLITDFGLARQLEADEGLTQTGAVVGTPGFMSPEQASGKGVTTATDIYSLGAILYELLCGRPPHAKESVIDTLMSVINDDPARPRELDNTISSDLELITLKCLEKNPDKRYTSAADVAADLRAYSSGEPLIVRAPSAYELARSWIIKHIGHVVWVPIIALGAGVISGYTAWDYTFGDTTQADQNAIDLLSPERTPLMMAAASSPASWGSTLGSVYSIHALLLVLSTAFLGLLTARLVRTSSRFSDITSGLSVGLLTGLISLISGLGPVIMLNMMYGSGPQSMAEDLELLAAIATRQEGFKATVLRDYPAVADVHPNDIAPALLRKIHISLRCDSLTGMWIASLVALGLFAVLGVIQTALAGSLIRASSFGKAFFAYSFFAIAFVIAGFVVSIDAFTWMLSGDHYYVRWAPPLLSLLFACVVMVAVVRRWHSLIQFLGFALLGSFANVFFLQIANVPPQVAMSVRSSINFAKQRIARNPEDINARAELAYSRLQWAGLLANISWTTEAFEEYQKGLEELRELDEPRFAIPDDANLDFRAVYYRSAGAMLLWMGKREEAIELFKEQIDKFGFDMLAIQTLTHTMAADGEYEALEQLLRSIEFTPQESHPRVRNKGAVLQWAFDTVRRHRRMTVEELRPWRESLVHAVLPLVDEATADEAEQRVNERNKKLRRWLLGEQVWNVYGPFDLEDAVASKPLDARLPPETQLLKDPLSVPPARKVRTEAGAPVWFHNANPAGAGLGWQRAHAAALAWTTFEVQQEQRLRLLLRNDDGIQVWLDGELQFSDSLNRTLYRHASEAWVKVKPGKHVLLIKVTQQAGDWGFSADLSQEDGFPLPAWTAGE